MKKLILSLSSLLLLASPMTAQRLVEDNFNQLKVQYTTPYVDVKASDYINLNIEGYVLGGEVGAPALPMLTSLLTVPFCNDMKVVVENAVYDTVELPAGIVMPLQPSRSKSDRSKPVFQLNEELYATDAYYGRPLASVEFIGVGRDRNYAQLTFSPVSINPVSGKMIVCRSADVTVRYVGADEERTMEVYNRYHTPAFSLGATFNSLLSSPKGVRTDAPIRMVIAAGRSLQCHAINEFADWKRKQGMMVDILYFDYGTLANTIAEQIKTLYTNATEEAPAPTYLLLIGDVAQLEAHNSRISGGGWNSPDNDHITDLYYVTWTDNDVIPDCYLGRFSATDTTTLRGIIAKTMLYEQYTFEDDSYLGRAALVAGEDNGYHTESGWLVDHAWIYADPAMDYIAYNYINATNGYNDVTYYKNDVSYAPNGVTVSGYCSDANASNALRNLYNTGIGWINYSAHGDWNNWSTPSFTVQNANSMTNNNKPSFMIGNCCLTNKFEKSVCLGEALLRRGNNAGAVGYIGGSNYTYWGEDFNWAVGVRNNVTHTLAPNYNASNLGTYDRLFHTHGENHTASVATAGQIVFYGNMAVQNSSSDLKVYYWEIYHLMGDPSLMPWLGRAKEPYAGTVATPSSSTITIQTMPNAYVAIVKTSTLELISAGFSDASGMVTLSHPAYINECSLSVTAQGYKPYYKSFNNVGINDVIDGDSWSVYPNPATTAVTVTGLPTDATLQLFDQTGRQLISTKSNTISTRQLAPGVYILRASTAYGTSTKKLVVK